ncbi:MAG: WD40 repeat domain-containing protein [Trichodesmium sp.]
MSAFKQNSISNFFRKINQGNKYKTTHLENLPKEYARSGDIKNYAQILTNIEFLSAKINHKKFGIESLLKDYNLINESKQLKFADYPPEITKSLQLIKESLELSKSILQDEKEQLSVQLFGRLLTYKNLPLIKQLLEQIQELENTPWLYPIHPGLTVPNAGLITTITEHDDSINAVAIAVDSQQTATINIPRHDEGVRSVAMLPNTTQVLSASEDNTIKVWNSATGKEVTKLIGHTEGVSALAIAPDGRVVSASEDKTLKVWDLETGEELLTIAGHDFWVNAVAITPEGRCVISGSSDHTVKIWNLATGTEMMTFKGHLDGIWSVVVTPDGKKVISASWDETLKIWDLASGKELRTLWGHTDGIWSVAVTPDSKKVISASWDDTIRIWDLASGKELRKLSGHTNTIRSVAVTPDGTRIVSAAADHKVKVWDIQTGKELMSFSGDNSFYCCTVGTDGKTVVAGDSLGVIHFLEMAG